MIWYNIQHPTELWKQKGYNLQAPPVYHRKILDLFSSMIFFSIIIFFHNSVRWNTSIFSQFECILRGNIELWKICMDLKIKYTVYPDTQSNLPIYFTLLPLVLSNCPTYFSMISWVFSSCSTHFSILPWFSFVFQFYFIDFSIGFHQCLDSFHYFTIGFKKLSNLFQHFPICAFQVIVQPISVCYHAFSSFVQIYFIIVGIDFRQIFLPLFRNNFKRRSRFKNALLGLDLTGYPFWMIFCEAICLTVLVLSCFFYN